MTAATIIKFDPSRWTEAGLVSEEDNFKLKIDKYLSGDRKTIGIEQLYGLKCAVENKFDTYLAFKLCFPRLSEFRDIKELKDLEEFSNSDSQLRFVTYLLIAKHMDLKYDDFTKKSGSSALFSGIANTSDGSARVCLDVLRRGSAEEKELVQEIRKPPYMRQAPRSRFFALTTTGVSELKDLEKYIGELGANFGKVMNGYDSFIEFMVKRFNKDKIVKELDPNFFRTKRRGGLDVITELLYHIPGESGTKMARETHEEFFDFYYNDLHAQGFTKV